MTEIFEVQDFRESLSDIKKEIEYEASTRPGEGPEVEKLFRYASQKITEAMEVLVQTEETMSEAENKSATEEPPTWDREIFSCEYCGKLECVCPEELDEDVDTCDNCGEGAGNCTCILADELKKGFFTPAKNWVTEGEPIRFAVEPGYAPLAFVLQEALDQAQRGKGKTCHANNKPFLEQEIITEGRSLGLGGHVFQIRKKVREAMNCEDTDRAVEDLLGAIVYTAAMVLLRRE